MTHRLATAAAAAAVVLGLGALASPALARNAGAPAESSVYADGAGRVVVDDDLTTGSVVTHRAGDSAQEGNAEQNSFPVWQYGRTSGGPR